MKLNTRQTKAAEAAETWDVQYEEGPEWAAEISDALHTLGSDPDPDDVDRVIGNGTWTQLHPCNECGKASNTVSFNMEYDYFCLCERCLRRAILLLQGVNNDH